MKRENINEICRFCYLPEQNQDDIKNPLISICKCSGSMKFIHLECLKEWLNMGLSLKITENVCSFYWKSFSCEICKSHYPSIFP